MSKVRLIASKPAFIPKEAKYRLRDTHAKVRNPSDKGYRPEYSGRDRLAWGTRVADSKAKDDNGYEQFSRQWGRITGGIAGGLAVAGAGGGLSLDRAGRRQAQKVRSGVAKAKLPYEPLEPFMRIGQRTRSGSYVITGLPKHRRLSAAGDRARQTERAVSAWAGRHPTTTMAAGYALGGAGVIAGAKSSGDKVRAARRDRRRELKAQAVGKRFEARYLRPSGMRQLARKYPGEFALGVGAPVGIGGVTAVHHSRRGTEDRHARNTALATLGGATAGQLGYSAAILGALAIPDRNMRRAQRVGYDGKTKSQIQNIKRKHWRSVGGSAGRATPAQEKAFYRSFPKTLPNWRTQRALGWASRGKTGRVIQGAMIGTGAAMGYNQVHKALYAREERLSPVRTLELGAGLALGAWGAGRSKMIGAALGHGVKMASTRGSDRAVHALQLAQAAQGTLRRSTAPGERAVRQIQAVDRAVRAVPRPLRGDVATAAGLLMAGNATPVHRQRYVPVSRPIPVRPVGW